MAEPAAKVTRKWLAVLEEEVSGWMKEDLINQDQAGAILSRYAGLREREKEEGRSKLVTALAIMGALLLGVGVILFFASNWQVMPKWLKVGLVFGSFIAAYGIGYYLAFEKQSYPRIGRAVIFLGTVLYGSGIWLIAQIFHISSHYPNGVLLWAVGIFPVILITGAGAVFV